MRCAATIRDPDSGVRDLDTLRLITVVPRAARAGLRDPLRGLRPRPPARYRARGRCGPARLMRILLVSQMYPGPDDPDLGVFVQGLEQALPRAGTSSSARSSKAAAVAGGGTSRLARQDARRRAALPAGRRLRALPRPDRARGRARRAPDAARRHRTRAGRRERRLDPGRPRRRRGSSCGVRLRSSRSPSGCAARLEQRSRPRAARPRWSSAGVDLARFPLLDRADGERPAYLCVGSLSERKNVVRLGDAFDRARRGQPHLRRRRAASRRARGPAGRAPRRARCAQDELPALLAAARRRLPAEPRRAVRARRARGDGVRPLGRRHDRRRAHRVRPARGGVLVDPTDTGAIADAMRSAAAMPCPNRAARAAAAEHDVALQAARVEAILARAAGLD